MQVINFFGGPGCGKTTAALGLTHCLKKCHVLSEYVSEYAKHKIYEKSPHMLNEQNYIFANQEHSLHVLRDEVSFAITDSPLPLSAHYAPPNFPQSFKKFVMAMYATYDNVNIFIERNPELGFQQDGRVHSAADSDLIASHLKRLLDSERVPYTTIKAGDELPERIFASMVRSGIVDVPLAGQQTAVKLIERADAFDLAAIKESSRSLPNVDYAIQAAAQARAARSAQAYAR